MSWIVTRDVEDFATHALSLLESDPAVHTVALTSLGRLRSSRSYSDEPPVYAWLPDASGAAVGAVLVTPPYELMLAVVPPEAVEALVAALRREVDLPGVHGEREVAYAFAERWTGGSGFDERMQQRLYVLGSLRAPTHRPDGSPRLADSADVALVLELWMSFAAEAHAHVTERQEDIVQDRVESGLLWFWEVGGVTVSMAGRSAPAAGVSRIGPVYTPPQHRRCGYGAAVTLAATQASLDAGGDDVVLFTDLANPTSNAIYQRLGYEPRSDSVLLSFPAAPRRR